MWMEIWQRFFLKMDAFSRIAVLIMLAGTSGAALHICGNFCGPDWCDASSIEECSSWEHGSCQKSSTDCNETGTTDGSCADACCKVHDSCCGSSDRRTCNNNVINCLKVCEQTAGPHCYHGIVPVPVAVVLTAMELDPYSCCGTTCNTPDETFSLRGDIVQT